MEPTPPFEADALRGFIAAFVFQLALVEICRTLVRKPEPRPGRYDDFGPMDCAASIIRRVSSCACRA